MYSDSYFAYPAVDAVEKVFSYTKNPVYLYDLSYRATNSFSQIFGDKKGDYGKSIKIFYSIRYITIYQD